MSSTQTPRNADEVEANQPSQPSHSIQAPQPEFQAAPHADAPGSPETDSPPSPHCPQQPQQQSSPDYEGVAADPAVDGLAERLAVIPVIKTQPNIPRTNRVNG